MSLNAPSNRSKSLLDIAVPLCPSIAPALNTNNISLASSNFLAAPALFIELRLCDSARSALALNWTSPSVILIPCSPVSGFIINSAFPVFSKRVTIPFNSLCIELNKPAVPPATAVTASGFSSTKPKISSPSVSNLVYCSICLLCLLLFAVSAFIRL